MKIAFILPGGSRTGGVRCTIALANGMLERGHHVRLLVYKENTPEIILRRNWHKLRYPHVSRWISYFKGSKASFTHIDQCSFGEDEIVVGMGLWSCTEINRLRRKGLKRVHYIHGETPWDVELINAAWCENLPKIAVASFLERSVRNICGQKVSAIIPNGIDTTEYYPSVPENERDGIGTIFNHGTHKDPVTLLGVLKKLHKERPQTPQRVFGASPRPKELSRRVYVRFPSIDKARNIYSQSLVWILGSRSEGFGLPIIEAMACGCAVVATDCGGPRDIIKDGENGFLVEVGNINEIVNKVKLLLDNDELRWRIAKKGKETVKRFSWKN